MNNRWCKPLGLTFRDNLWEKQRHRVCIGNSHTDRESGGVRERLPGTIFVREAGQILPFGGRNREHSAKDREQFLFLSLLACVLHHCCNLTSGKGPPETVKDTGETLKRAKMDHKMDFGDHPKTAKRTV